MSFVCDLKATFCDETCESGWETDREYGVIYPPMIVPGELQNLLPIDTVFHDWPSGLRSVQWTVACDALGICRYCRKEVNNEHETKDNGSDRQR